jgi:hypothetical protein
LENFIASRRLGDWFHLRSHFTFVLGLMAEVASIHSFSCCIYGESSLLS